MVSQIVLAMHGMPPRDFPAEEMQEFFMLHARMDSAPQSLSPELQQRHEELHLMMRQWERNCENDPFDTATQEMAHSLEKETGYPVWVGYNEFCAPSLEDALKDAASQEPEQVFIITPMLTRGGEHAEHDIPLAIQKAQVLFPNVEFKYCWPFDPQDIVQFLANQLKEQES